MSKTVLIVEATGIVDNVIELVPGTAYSPDPGILLLTVPQNTVVGPGMRLIAGSNPIAFEDVPVEEQPPAPLTQTEALNWAETKFREGLDLITAARALG